MAGDNSKNASRTPVEEEALKRELVKLIPHLRAFARTLAGEQAGADDLAQDAMMKAWDARNSFQMGTNMKAWTFMILRNQFYSEKRRSWRQSQLDQEAAERTLVAVTIPRRPSPSMNCAFLWPCCPPNSAKPWCWWGPGASPTRKPPRSATAPSAP